MKTTEKHIPCDHCGQGNAKLTADEIFCPVCERKFEQLDKARRKIDNLLTVLSDLSGQHDITGQKNLSRIVWTLLEFSQSVCSRRGPTDRAKGMLQAVGYIVGEYHYPAAQYEQEQRDKERQGNRIADLRKALQDIVNLGGVSSGPKTLDIAYRALKNR